MFKWYQKAKVCYVYLVDVTWSFEALDESHDMVKKSRWFTRGWTLQELLAPEHIDFYDRSWNLCGTKYDLQKDILVATNIHPDYLYGNFRDVSIATKMSWASKRTTKEPEDMAYSLLGIFGVPMDLRYGEGRGAFRRLQEILVEKIPDESIFAWTKPDVKGSHGILAAWPDYFETSGNLIHRSKEQKPRPAYRLTHQGLEWPLANRQVLGSATEWNNFMISRRRNTKITLNCWRVDKTGDTTVTIRLKKAQDGRWRRINCDREELSRKVDKSSSWLGQSYVTLVYVALD